MRDVLNPLVCGPVLIYQPTPSINIDGNHQLSQLSPTAVMNDEQDYPHWEYVDQIALDAARDDEHKM
jgi:hypothetical protein